MAIIDKMQYLNFNNPLKGRVFSIAELSNHHGKCQKPTKMFLLGASMGAWVYNKVYKNSEIKGK